MYRENFLRTYRMQLAENSNDCLLPFTFLQVCRMTSISLLTGCKERPPRPRPLATGLYSSPPTPCSWGKEIWSLGGIDNQVQLSGQQCNYSSQVPIGGGGEVLKKGGGVLKGGGGVSKGGGGVLKGGGGVLKKGGGVLKGGGGVSKGGGGVSKGGGGVSKGGGGVLKKGGGVLKGGGGVSKGLEGPRDSEGEGLKGENGPSCGEYDSQDY